MDNLNNFDVQDRIDIDINSIQGLQELTHLYQDSESMDKELIKDSVNKMLEKGYNVYSQKQYIQLAELLNTLNIVDLCSFSEIGNFIDFDEYIELQHKFSIKLINGLFRLFPGTNLGFINPVQGGYILNGKFYEELNFLYSDDISNNNQFHLKLDDKHDNKKIELLESQNKDLKNLNVQLIDQKDIITQENQKLLAKIQQLEIDKQSSNLCEVSGKMIEKSPENIINNQEYKVKNGDTLWQIVKMYYGLTSNRDIANCVNKLVKYNIENNNAGKLAEDNTPDGIFGDEIYVGQKILLAKELVFRNQKFHLKSKK